jgi:hypothetical protein
MQFPPLSTSCAADGKSAAYWLRIFKNKQKGDGRGKKAPFPKHAQSGSGTQRVPEPLACIGAHRPPNIKKGEAPKSFPFFYWD